MLLSLLLRKIFNQQNSCSSLDEMLLEAASDGNLEGVKYCLLNGANCNFKLKDHGTTPLHCASKSEIIVELLRYGASVNQKDSYGLTPLCYAVSRKNGLEVTKILLSVGACVNVETNCGSTPLHYACNSDITKELLLHLADVNTIDKFGRAPIHSALIDRKGLDVIKVLLNAGAVINFRFGKFKNSLLHFADSLDVTRELLSRGVSPNALKIDGQSPLHCAVKHMKGEAVVRELLQHGALIDHRENEGFTPLALAMMSHNRNYRVISALVEHGANINYNMYDRSVGRFFTIIDYAANFDRPCARLLIKLFVLKNFEEDFVSNIFLGHGFDDLLEYINNCISEIGKMKADHISPKLTLYELINSGDIIKPIFKIYREIEESIVANYPIYFDVVLRYLKNCLERGKLLCRLHGLVICCSYIVNGVEKEFHLNSDCVLMIAKYLSANDILNLILACE